MQILSHRWLEPSNPNFEFSESSFEAFENHLQRWYWLEFDINFSRDWVCFIFHDESLARISQGKDTKKFSELSYNEIKKLWLWDNSFITFEQLIALVKKYRKAWEYSALHLKYPFHNQKTVDFLVAMFKKYSLYEYIFIFDVSIHIAKKIKSKNNKIRLFPSVAHDYDIKRYNECVWWTLLSTQEVTQHSQIFDWVWLDEWDRNDEDWWKKQFYTLKTFDYFRSLWLKIWLVTPELHGTSPWLLWWEKHQDSHWKELEQRVNVMIDLEPDFICSDNLHLLK